MKDTITPEKLDKYFKITREALDMAEAEGFDSVRIDEADDFFDMATRYYLDGLHFKEKGDYVNAFAAVSYAHGWLDAGARQGLFKVKDSRLFTVD